MRRDRKQEFRPLLLVVGIAVVMFVAIFLVAALGFGSRDGVKGGAKPEQKVYTREDFARLVDGKSEDEVLKLVGRPDKTQEPDRIGRSFWYYNHITRDTISGKLDSSVQVVFQNGVVDTVNFH